jgi:hypothetical protein
MCTYVGVSSPIDDVSLMFPKFVHRSFGKHYLVLWSVRQVNSCVGGGKVPTFHLNGVGQGSDSLCCSVSNSGKNKIMHVTHPAMPFVLCLIRVKICM